ncbi:hypothetical protein ACFL1G_02370 [Planctomycetota bacterium]
MKKLINKKRKNKPEFTMYRRPDSHNWETRMEIHRLLSGKSDLKLKPDLQPTA